MTHDATTVRAWLTSRTARVRPALTERLLAALGRDADAPASRTPELCLAAAARSLDSLLSEGRFERDSALDLLTIDALTTYAFEHASESGASEQRLAELARQGAQLLGQLTAQRV
jgi:hypothetical protein